jgi:hypothetical protein
MPSSSLVSKGNTAVTSQLRTSAKIIRSMKEGLSSEIIRPLRKADPRKTRGRKHEKNLDFDTLWRKKKLKTKK